MTRLIGRRRTHIPLGQAAVTAFLALSYNPSAAVHSFSSSSSSIVSRQIPFLSRPSHCVNTIRGGSTLRETKDIFRAMSTATEAETTQGGATMTPKIKLDALRAKMKELDLQVYLVPSDDPHLSEYVPHAYMRRNFISGFGGSAGTAVITQDEAFVWTDSRYWNEASMSLDSDCWKLQKAGLPTTPTIPKFLSEMAVKHYKATSAPLAVGLDGYVHPASFVKEMKDAFNDSAKNELDEEDLQIGVVQTVENNLVDSVWGSDRPEVPYNPFRVHPLEYAGWSIDTKLEKIRSKMTEKKATMAVFCTLDDVAYLLNVRATGDVDTCPVGIAYATVTHDAITLYCDARKVQSEETALHLKDVVLKPYEAIVTDVSDHCTASAKNKVWLDTSRANFALSDVIPKKALIDSQNAVTPMKACKNLAELKGMRQAHIVDGVAMAKFMATMVEKINNKGETISEVEIDKVLTGFRAEQPGFVECSFPTIAGVGPNAAIIHYSAQENDLMKYLDDKTPILIDSGGQYTYGTTDVTRSWHFGEATDEFKEAYTRVLKGHIALDTMIFPENSPGFVLDVFARKSLWEVGMDYGHGTGHGVGAALNVHEGPMGISPRFGNQEGLKKGMVMSNEPGYYVDGKFGIRIENLMEIRFVDDKLNEAAESDAPQEDDATASADKKFLKFDKITMIPIQKNLVDLKLMSPTELDWLDNYHEEVLSKISPYLEANSPAMKWLEKSCEKIERN